MFPPAWLVDGRMLEPPMLLRSVPAWLVDGRKVGSCCTCVVGMRMCVSAQKDAEIKDYIRHTAEKEQGAEPKPTFFPLSDL